MKAIVNGLIVTPDEVLSDKALLFDEKIAAIVGKDEPLPESCEKIDAAGGCVLPGFVDLHVHGGGGADFLDGDPGAICEFVVRWSQTSLTFYLILPYYAVDDLGRRQDRSRLDWLNEFSDPSPTVPAGVRKSKIRLSVLMARSSITVEDLLQLSPGDIIATDQSADSPIEVYIQDKLKFLAAPGQLHGQKAIEILSTPEE